jgi:hypothetical protein
MRQDRTHSDSFETWQHLVTSVTANAADLTHLEVPRQKLEAMLAEVKDLNARQAALTAGKQDASKRIEELVNNGRKLATFLKTGVREHYGNKAEKLAEFRLQPFRGRKLKQPEAPAPAGATAPKPAVEPHP